MRRSTWTSLLWVGGASAFAPPGSTVPTARRRPAAAVNSDLALFPKWGRGKKDAEGGGGTPSTAGEDDDAWSAKATRTASNGGAGAPSSVEQPATSPKPAPRKFKDKTDYDVVVVGAGCAGVGTALMLTKTFGLDASRVLCVEQGDKVGTSFRSWPEEMRFISPSFNQQGWTRSFDLNSVIWGTSPADLLRSEHPSGEEYAIYLETLVERSGIRVRLGTRVESITDVGGKDEPGPFVVETERTGGGERGRMTSRYIVWAAGEFQFPKDRRKMEYVFEAGEENKDKLPTKKFNNVFMGAEYCLHNSKVKSWAELPGDDYVVIGGYESGVDAAFNLAKAGKKCQVLASTPTWCLKTGDPSSELAPYTAARLREVLSPGFSPQPQLLAPIRVIAVDKAKGGGYNIAAGWKPVDKELSTEGLGFRTEDPGEAGEVVVLQTQHPPILCNGFEGSVAAEARDLFDFPSDADRKKGCAGDGPLLTRNDESTKVPGVFLVGPSVSHGALSFCFVYKFRQRFAVVADAICTGLGRDTREIVEECRLVDMYLDDFATCEDACDC